jgi:hypothetical protein
MFGRAPKNLAVELDGELFHLAGETLQSIPDINALKGDYWLLSDLQEGVSRTMVLEGEYKYLDLIAGRKMQESGEFDEPVEVLGHWKQKKSKTACEIFFTAVPARLQHQYRDLITAHEDNIILFPLYAVLYGVLQKIAPATPVAIVLQHSRFADIVVGTAKQVYYANRAVAFDQTQEQLEALWETVRSDLSAAEAEHRISISKAYILNWIDSGPPPPWTEGSGLNWQPVETEDVRVGETVNSISLFNALRQQTAKHSMASAIERIRFATRRMVPFINILFLLVIIGIVAGVYSFHLRTDDLKQQRQQLEARIGQIEFETPQEISVAQFTATVDFIRELAAYRRAPAYKKIINDIAAGITPDMLLEQLKMGYAPEGVSIEVFGRVAAPFDKAYRGYQDLMQRLRQSGYRITEERFDTEIQESRFLIKLTHGIP